MESHRKIRVNGRVQGVWFRKYAFDRAQSLGLSGFVKNLLDGTVYIEASGEMEKVDVFVQWCKTGSPLSNVESVQSEESPIRHTGLFRII